jgi:hypothetical protein
LQKKAAALLISHSFNTNGSLSRRAIADEVGVKSVR